MRRQLCALTLTLLLTLAATAAQAQWSSDPAVNLVLADRPDTQQVLQIAATADGGAYVGWFDNASGNFDVYLQRLDPLGFELWGHNGMLVSDHPQAAWTTTWRVIADSAGNAVLAFSDIRDDGSYAVHAYRVGAGGEMLWGADGIALSVPRLNQLPSGVRIAEASDGDFVFVWSEWKTGGGGSLMLQRLAPDGAVRFATGGIILAKGKGGAPAFGDLVAAESGSVIVSWLTDNLLESDSKHLRAQKFAADGGSLWNKPVTVFDEYSLPAAYKPDIQSDGAGGAFLVWHYAPWMVYNTAIQHLDADGQELFPHNGVTVATDPNVYHYQPALSHDPVSGETYVFFREYDSVDGRYGIYGQRFSADGARMWGDAGAVFVPLSPVEVSSPVCVPAAGGAMVFWMDRQPATWDQMRVFATRVDGLGNMLWAGEPILASSYMSQKGDLQAARGPFGTAMLVWVDYRNSAETGNDIYGQNVNPDGTLGN